MLPLYYYNTKYTYHFASRNEWKICKRLWSPFFECNLQKYYLCFLCWILLVHTYIAVGQLFWNKCLSLSSKFPSLSSNRSKKDKSPKVTWHNYVIQKRLFYRSKHICAYELLTKKNHEALRKTPNSNTERRRLKRGWKIGNDS